MKPCEWEKPGTCQSIGVAFYCKLEEHGEDTPHSEEVLGPAGKTRGAWAEAVEPCYCCREGCQPGCNCQPEHRSVPAVGYQTCNSCGSGWPASAGPHVCPVPYAPAVGEGKPEEANMVCGKCGERGHVTGAHYGREYRIGEPAPTPEKPAANLARCLMALTDIANDSCTCARQGECHVCIARQALRPVCPACGAVPCEDDCDEGDVARSDAAEPRS